MQIYLDKEIIEILGEDLNLPNIQVQKNFDTETIEVIVSSTPENFLEELSRENVTFILYANERDLNDLSLLKKYNLNHIIGKSDLFTIELKIMLQKIYHKNYYGVEKFLEEDAVIYSTEITHSKDINEEVEVLLNKLDYSDTFDTPKDNLRVVLNELATNAFFHQSDLILTNRKDSIFTSFENSILLIVARDKNHLLVYAKDKIGTLKKETLLDSIMRGFIERRPKTEGHGAGLGLFMVYENLNQFHVNKKNTHFCEFIGIIDVNKRYKKFKERVTSFHFFEE